ncbi:uncharacterized protein LOC143559762 [Bidens hawaiensis]|uniref:uncharacterized protein LOC143559762 n=1 Tax=Bidens hawaiensis TaxID=980011 RepID=UPI00404B3E8C
MLEVVKKEVLKWLDAGIIFPISDSTWVSPTQTVPKKAGIQITRNERGEEIATRPVTGWRICVDYRKLNAATSKDHFPLPFIDQIIENLSVSTSSSLFPFPPQIFHHSFYKGGWWIYPIIINLTIPKGTYLVNVGILSAGGAVTLMARILQGVTR